MLSTAIVHAFDRSGSRIPCRVLLDCGSQANFISRSFLNTLGIGSQASNISISGINNTVMRSSQLAQVRIQSRVNSFCAIIDCVVTEQVTGKLSAFTLNRGNFEIPQNIKLADPNFNVSFDIDILIGAELFWSILCVGQIRPFSNHPIWQKTKLGWILSGRLNISAKAFKLFMQE